ncbi:hypothetical protein [Pseudoxanthomonas putridarboris]|uniref:Uncharacterized protein n=1 Tax=Pseudoxanthomonas putridarboris TaxID=752605 RepID=A0ABU9J2Y7_9GAMM
MEIPQALWRFPTAAAIAGLARRFEFTVHPQMQDSECELANPGRIDEFLAAYEQSDLSDDELFLLMEIVLNSFEFSDTPLADHPGWSRTLHLLESNIGRHIYSILYFADPESDWRIGQDLRLLASEYGDSFGLPPNNSFKPNPLRGSA